jgi:1-acyl-sn-glycerol-3-phosphate acyltransferase
MSSTKVKKIPLMSDKPYDFNWDKPLVERVGLYHFWMPVAHILLNHEFETLDFYGTENVPQNGPFLLVSNHVNGFDPITMVYGIRARRRFFFMAKEEFFRTFYIRWLLEPLGGFPVKRGTADRDSMKFAQRVLEDGRFGLVIFPQGSRDRQRKRPELDSTANGFAMIAREAKVPVVPASVHLEPDLDKKHPKCIVRFGEPIPFEDLGFTPGSRKKKELNAAAEIIWRKVQELWDKDEM